MRSAQEVVHAHTHRITSMCVGECLCAGPCISAWVWASAQRTRSALREHALKRERMPCRSTRVFEKAPVVVQAREARDNAS
eukprot:3542040-Pleurochrysis_carterae.AAC.1